MRPRPSTTVNLRSSMRYRTNELTNSVYMVYTNRDAIRVMIGCAGGGTETVPLQVNGNRSDDERG